MNRIAYELCPVRFGEIYLLFTNQTQERRLTKCLWGEFRRDNDTRMTWQNGAVNSETPEFQEEINALVQFLREGPLKDKNAMADYCRTRPDGRIGAFAGRMHWGFRVSTATQRCYLRCSPGTNGGTFCLLCYQTED